MADPHSDDFFVRAARKLGVLTDAQLAECRHLQRGDSRGPALSQIAFEHAYLDSRTLFAALRESDRLRAGERTRRVSWPWIALALTASTALLLGFVTGILVTPPGTPAPEAARPSARNPVPLRAPPHLEAGRRLLEQASREQFRPSLDANRIDETLHLAVEDLSAACALDPSNATAFHSRARARLLLGDYERADQDLARTLELAPASKSAYFDRASLRLEQGLSGFGLHRDPDIADTSAPWGKMAAEDFAKSREQGLTGPELLLAEAAIAWSTGGAEAAYSRCSSSLWETTTVEELHRFRGEVLAAKEEFASAERAFSRAIELRAHYPEALLARGLVRLKLGQNRAAAEDLTYCVERRRFMEPALFYRAHAYAAQGRYSSALLDCRRCLELESPRSERLRDLLKELEPKAKF